MTPNWKIYNRLTKYRKLKFRKLFFELLSKKQFDIFLDCYGSKNETDFFAWIDWIKEKQSSS